MPINAAYKFDSDDLEKAFCFVRFGERKFIEQFLSEGLIYMNSIDYFKSIEGHPERRDKNENITGLFQPNTVTLKINGRSMKDLVGPITLYIPQEDKFHASHIFCLSHLSNKTKVRDDGKIFDKRMTVFESMAIITSPRRFIERLNAALEQAVENGEIYHYQNGKVEYICGKTYSGEMNPFRKTDDYAHQMEFRVIVSAFNRTTPFVIRLGALIDIAAGVDMKDFKNEVIRNANETSNLIFN